LKFTPGLHKCLTFGLRARICKPFKEPWNRFPACRIYSSESIPGRLGGFPWIFYYIAPYANWLTLVTLAKIDVLDFEDVEVIREGHVVISAVGSVLKLDMVLRTNMLTQPARQCCGSGSVGSVCFWASWIRILLSSSKNSKKNLDSYCFVTSFWHFYL
jgi:hypothetical protein